MDEALDIFKKTYEKYRDRFLKKKNDLETWEFFYKSFYIRNNSTGDEIYYKQINNITNYQS